MSGSALTRDELISGLHVGTKITPGSVVDIRRLPDGRTVWLEKGTDAAGLQHIYKRHEADFVNKGISRDDIPNVVMSVLERGKLSEPMVRLMFIASRTMVLSKTSQLGLAQTASWFEAKGKKGTDLFIGLTSSFRYKE